MWMTASQGLAQTEQKREKRMPVGALHSFLSEVGLSTEAAWFCGKPGARAKERSRTHLHLCTSVTSKRHFLVVVAVSGDHGKRTGIQAIIELSENKPLSELP